MLPFVVHILVFAFQSSGPQGIARNDATLLRRGLAAFYTDSHVFTEVLAEVKREAGREPYLLILPATYETRPPRQADTLHWRAVGTVDRKSGSFRFRYEGRLPKETSRGAAHNQAIAMDLALGEVDRMRYLRSPCLLGLKRTLAKYLVSFQRWPRITDGIVLVSVYYDLKRVRS